MGSRLRPARSTDRRRSTKPAIVERVVEQPDGIALASSAGNVAAPGRIGRTGRRTTAATGGSPAVAASRVLGQDAFRTALVLLGIGFILRLLLFPLGNFTIDTNTMTAWAQRLVSDSPRSFYTGTGLTDHLPGDLWILWLVGSVYHWFAPISTDLNVPVPFLWMLKLVPAITDTVTGLLIFLIGRRLATPVSALVATMLFVFNPAAVFIGSVWAQWDSLSAMVAVGAIYLFLRGRPEWSIPALVYACLIKPQMAVIGLFVALAFVLVYIAPHVPAMARWVREEKPVETLRTSLMRAGLGVAASVAVFLAVCLPFNIGLFPGMGAFTIWDRISYALNVYPNTTLNAFTLWGLLSDNWSPDKPSAVPPDQAGTVVTTFLGVSYQTIGTFLTVVAIVGIVWLTLKAWRQFGYQALFWGMTVGSFAAYMLPTRGHERYLFPTMVVSVLLVALLPRFVWLYAGLTGTFLLNVYWVYALYFPSQAPKIGPIKNANFIQMMSTVNVVLLAAALAIGYALLTRGNTFTAPGWLPGWALPDDPTRPITAPRAGGGGRPRLATPADTEASPRDFVHADREAATRPAWQVWYLPLAIAIVGAVFFVIRIGTPDDYIYDEVYHAFTAAQYVDGNPNTFWVFADEKEDARNGVFTWYHGSEGDRGYDNFSYEWTHPPLGKEIIAIGIWLFGDNPFGWRFTSWIFGAIGLFIAYRLAMALTGRWLVGAIAAGLLMVDGLYFVQSRTSMVDIHIVVFIMAALWAFLRYLRLPSGASTREVGVSTLLLGLAMGASFATKWNGAYPMIFMIGIALARLAWMWVRASPLGRDPEARSWADLRNHLIFVPVNLILLPLLVYFLSYFPMFLFGFGFADWVELQRQMLYYHTVGVNAANPHNYYSKWWQWPLALMPVWYGTHNGPADGDTRGYVFTLVNPFLAWSMIPAVAAVAWLWLRDRTRQWAPALVILIGFYGQWLIWAGSPRGAFQYHFLPMVPFGVIAIATLVEYGWRNRSLPLSNRALKWAPLAVLGVGVAIQIAVFFGSKYPLTNDEHTPDGYHAWGNYGIPVALFGLVALAMASGLIRTPRTVSLRAGAVTYVVVAVLVFAFLFPIYAATQLTQAGLDLRTWFPGWTVR
jgi:dolichyl-phosphate-mannose-protein mannosyltransferase